MISSYISYLRLINDKLIRNGINLGVTLKDDMSVDELEDAKATLESYCYFNDVLTLCDSAYALDLVDGCKVKLYTDLVKEEVYEQYNEKFEMASNLLQSGMDNPLDEVKEPLSLSGYLNSLGKSSVKDLAVSVSAEEPKKVSVENLGDLFNISNEPKFDYVEDDSDEDEEFDYSDDNADDEDVEKQEDTSDNEEDDDSDVFFDFRNQSDEDEEPDEDEEEFDYSDDSEVFDNAEELPLTDDEDEESEEFNYSDDTEEASDSDDEEDFNYSDDEVGSDTSEDDSEDSDEEEFDYSDYTEDSENSDEEDFNYSDDEYEEESDEEDPDNEDPSDGYSEDDEEFDYSDDDSSSEDEEEDFDYSDDEEPSDGYLEDDEDIDYSDDNDDSEEDIDYSDDNESEEDYDEDYDEEASGYDEEPMFNVGTSSHVQTAPKPKEAYEKDAELIEGIVDGGAKLLKSVGNKVRHSLFNGKK